MATTKWKIAEQVMSLISGGNPSVASFSDYEVMEAINQVLNKMLRADYLNVNLPSGETIPDGYILANYDSVPVSIWKDRSRAKLPAIPVTLPRGMGVYHVGAAGDPDSFYVPIPAGHMALVKTQPLINDLLGRIGYEVKDGYTIFHRDITNIGVSSVDMQLVVADFTKYGDYETLPIPPEMEYDVVVEVSKLFSSAPPPDKKVDSTNDKNN